MGEKKKKKMLNTPQLVGGISQSYKSLNSGGTVPPSDSILSINARRCLNSSLMNSIATSPSPPRYMAIGQSLVPRELCLIPSAQEVTAVEGRGGRGNE